MRLWVGWTSSTFWFQQAKRVEVRREQFNIAGAVTSGFATALKYDGLAGCDPYIDFIRREGQEIVHRGVK
jgi:hypothetical protein